MTNATPATEEATIVKIADAVRRAFGEQAILCGLLRDRKGAFCVAWYKPTPARKSGTHIVCWNDEGEAFLEGGHYIDSFGGHLTEHDFCQLAVTDLRKRTA